jgi:peptide deformylase
MSLLPILKFPDPRLRKKAELVERMDDALRKVLDDMVETMYHAEGIGLAATQVNVHLRMLVIDISEDRSSPMVFINPEITVIDPESLGHEEGCLSVPGYYELVTRPRKVRVNALDRQGDPFELEAEGILAVCIQHEVDHLNGKLFVDYISSLKRERIRSKLEKEHRQQKTATPA